MYSKQFLRLEPYTPGEQPQDRSYIKLNTNETPYPPCPEIKDFLTTLSIDELRLYPDPNSEELRGAIGKAENLPVSNIFVSNGSDEALSFCFFTFFDGTRGPVLFPEHTYSFYPVYCRYYNLPSLRLPLAPDFSIDFEVMLREIAGTCGVIFPNPNAPTGRYEEPEDIERVLEEAGKDRAVIIDEAYINFGGTSAASLLSGHPNLIVMKTLSKGYGLAGARVGYTLASEEITSALFAVKDSFNSYPVDRLSQKIGAIALGNPDYYRGIQRKIIETREKTKTALEEMGWDVVPSKANFIFARKKGIDGKVLYGTLKTRGILVRHFQQAGIDDYIRITIGTAEEMEEFLEKCEKYL